MKSVYNFVVKPIGKRYNNTKKVGDKELVLNTEIFNHQYINRNAKVLAVPIVGETDIQSGYEVIIHHNVFRRWYNIKGVEKNSKSYFTKDTYLVAPDQIFLYKRNNKWYPPKGYCFVQPLKQLDNSLSGDMERPLMGVVKYSDGSVEKGSLVGFRPGGEYEFVIDGKRLYRILSNFITVKYEYQGDEEEYNPSWAKSS